MSKSQAKLRRSDEKLRQYSKNLEAMVRERTQKLKEAQEKLFHNEKLAAIGELASGVAHQLRNPLGGINNAAYFIQMKYGDVKKTADVIGYFESLPDRPCGPNTPTGVANTDQEVPK